MPTASIAITINPSFKMLTHATARTPLANTTAASKATEIAIAAGLDHQDDPALPTDLTRGLARAALALDSSGCQRLIRSPLRRAGNSALAHAQGDPADAVYVDLWEDYLEAV